MPTVPLRHCLAPGCPVRVSRGYCPTHTHRVDRSRRLARTLTYSESWWRKWRLSFVTLLIQAGIAPVCGAHLPGGPVTTHSRCQAEGVLTGASADGTSLHLNHAPELTEAEQHDRSIVCDPLRIELLCASCHNALSPAYLAHVGGTPLDVTGEGGGVEMLRRTRP